METNTSLIGQAVRFLRIIGVSLLGGFISAAIMDTTGTVLLVRSLLAYNDWAPLKILCGFALAYHWKPILGFLKECILRTWDLVCDTIYALAGETKRPSDCIDGIPRTELLDFLFTEKSFKQEDVMIAFRIPRYKVTELKKNFERVGVLVRGENNAHILNPDFSRQDVAKVIEKARTAADLQPLFRKRDDGSLTSEPSAKEIQARVTSLLSLPSAGFRKVAVSAS